MSQPSPQVQPFSSGGRRAENNPIPMGMQSGMQMGQLGGQDVRGPSSAGGQYNMQNDPQFAYLRFGQPPADGSMAASGAGTPGTPDQLAQWMGPAFQLNPQPSYAGPGYTPPPPMNYPAFTGGNAGSGMARAAQGTWSPLQQQAGQGLQDLGNYSQRFGAGPTPQLPSANNPFSDPAYAGWMGYNPVTLGPR